MCRALPVLLVVIGIFTVSCINEPVGSELMAESINVTPIETALPATSVPTATPTVQPEASATALPEMPNSLAPIAKLQMSLTAVYRLDDESEEIELVTPLYEADLYDMFYEFTFYSDFCRDSLGIESDEAKEITPDISFGGERCDITGIFLQVDQEADLYLSYTFAEITMSEMTTTANVGTGTIELESGENSFEKWSWCYEEEPINIDGVTHDCQSGGYVLTIVIKSTGDNTRG